MTSPGASLDALLADGACHQWADGLNQASLWCGNNGQGAVKAQMAEVE